MKSAIRDWAGNEKPNEEKIHLVSDEPASTTGILLFRRDGHGHGGAVSWNKAESILLSKRIYRYYDWGGGDFGTGCSETPHDCEYKLYITGKGTFILVETDLGQAGLLSWLFPKRRRPNEYYIPNQARAAAELIRGKLTPEGEVFAERLVEGHMKRVKRSARIL